MLDISLVPGCSSFCTALPTMDRPPSQLENVRPSGLKPPSRLPAMSSNGGRNALLDTSQSDLNARSGGMTGSMGPPVIPTKHKIPGLPEPAPKRKTLAERAGEPIHPRSGIPPPTKATIPRVTSHIGHARTASAAATATAGTTNGFRPASRQQRVASVEEDNEAEAGATGKRKGTYPMSSHHLPLRTTHTHSAPRTAARSAGPADDRGSVSACSSRHPSDGSTSSDNTAASSAAGQPPRNISLASALAELSLAPEPHPQPHAPAHPPPPHRTKHRPSLDSITEAQRSPAKSPHSSCTPALRHAQSSQVLQTPSPLKHKSSVNGLHTSRTSARMDCMPFYLTKESLTPVKPVAWDTKGRLDDMEQMYSQLRSQFASAADSKAALEESLSLYKSRGA